MNTRFRASFDNAAVGIAHLAIDGRCIEANDQVCEITGYLRDELVRLNVSDITHPEDRTEDTMQMRRILRGEIVRYRRHKRYVRKDGSLRWVAVTRSLVRLPDGTPDFLVATIEDVTRTKEAELALQTSNSLLDGIIENLPALISLKRADDLRFVRVNRAGAEMLGRPAEDLVGKDNRDVFHRGDADFLTNIEHEVLSSGKVKIIDEAAFRAADGRTRYLKVSKAALRAADGSPTHVLGVSVDITERKQTEEHVKLLLHEINHRAKNLLAVVGALARYTAREVGPEDFLQRFGERLDALGTNHDLLVKANWQGMDIADLMTAQLAYLGGLVGTRITLNGPRITLAPSASQAIGMAIHELATNAVKHGALSDENGSVRITWAICTRDGAPHVRIRWSEHGGPPTHSPDRCGFGQTIMIGVIEYELGAEVSLTYPHTGVIWEMSAPAQSMVEGKRHAA